MSKRDKGTAVGRISLVCIAALTLAACDANSGFGRLTASENSTSDAPITAKASSQRLTERDVERPDVFSVSDRGLWDGRPSLGGIWVAHPDVQNPERVIIRNAENDREVTGALFRRERENPGPVLQVSSDAADALGILAGAPTELNVVALRREEVEVIEPEAEEAPTEDGLAAPVSVVAAVLDPAELPPEPEPEPSPVAVTLAPAVEAATAVIEQTALAAADVADEATDAVVDVSSVLSPAMPAANGPRAQVGVFSVEANAKSAVSQIKNAGIAAEVIAEMMGGRTVWRVVAGPMVDEGGVAQLKALGFVDAFVVADAE
jgi:hypothetical protein